MYKNEGHESVQPTIKYDFNKRYFITHSLFIMSKFMSLFYVYVYVLFELFFHR